MGESLYCMKARFGSKQAAAAALPKVKAFLEQMAEAEDAWHAIREQTKRPVGKRFAELKANHPEVFGLLEIESLISNEMVRDRHMNLLAGWLDSPASDPDWKIWQEGPVIGFQGNVWDMAHWVPLTMAMKKFGAVRAAFVRDGSMDQVDGLKV